MQARRGCYHDAIHEKKNEVHALIANPFGGVTRTVEGLIRRLHSLKGTDRTGSSADRLEGGAYI